MRTRRPAGGRGGTAGGRDGTAAGRDGASSRGKGRDFDFEEVDDEYFDEA